MTVTLSFSIGFDTEGIGISECESIFREFGWICVAAGESILGDCTTIDFECDIAVW